MAINREKKTLKTGQHAETRGLLRTTLCKHIRPPHTHTPLTLRDLDERHVARL